MPSNIWPGVKERIIKDLKEIKVGPTEDFSNFVNAVIDEKSFDKLAGYIDRAKADKTVEIIAGGTYDKSKGYFIEPTVIVTKDASSLTMCEEIFGPVMTIYVYHSENFEQTLASSPHPVQPRYSVEGH